MEHIKRINSRQFLTIFLIAVFSPAVVFLPTVAAKIAHQAAWVSVLCSVIPMILFVLILSALMIKHNGKNLAQINILIFGKYLGVFINALYLVWIMILTALYLRYFAERMLSTILPDTSMYLVIISFVIIAGIVAENGFLSFARLSKILFYFFIGLFLIVTIYAAVAKGNIENILPVSRLDAGPVALGVFPVLAMWFGITYLMFCGENLETKGLRKDMIFISIAVTVISLLIVFATIGILGFEASDKIEMAFAKAVKYFKAADPFRLMDAAFFSMWIFADFVIVTLYTHASTNICASAANVRDRHKNWIVYGILIIVTLISFLLWKNSEELKSFSENWYFVNFAFGLFPVVTFVVGKIKEQVTGNK